MNLQKQPLVNQIPGDHADAVQNLIDSIKDNPASLFGLANQSILSARQFNREMVTQLCNLAAKYEKSPIQAQRPLTGKILISAFYEPSTRTRLSFESAWHRLGGDVMSITDPLTTGIAKGESHKDVAEMLSAYGDIVVLRDPEQNTIYEMMESLRIPVINAGNGPEEHPTQALADMYAIFKWRPDLLKKQVASEDRIRVAIVGVPSIMRTVRSLLLLLSLFADAIKEVVIVSDSDDVFSEGQKEELDERGLNIRVSDDMQAELPDTDVVYINAIAWVGDSYEEHGKEYILDKESPIKDGAIILHPLARGAELSTDMDNTQHNWYFAQARGAVYMRMALLTCYVWLF